MKLQMNRDELMMFRIRRRRELLHRQVHRNDPKLSEPAVLTASARTMIENDRQYREQAYKALRQAKGIPNEFGSRPMP